jgi:hypothetical protein
MSDTLTSLVKRIDQVTAEHPDALLGSFVVMLSDDEALEKQLKALAAREKLRKVVLTIDNKAGPPKWRIARDADVTVVLYGHGMVKANHAFRKGELMKADVDRILADLSKILPGNR